jgi:MFS transporter, DHA3 family, macrolide efflux protein
MDFQNRNWQRPFFTIWIGQAFSLLGSSLVQFAIIWWLTQQTGSGTALAAASVAGLLPQILLGPFAGALIDRWDRKWVMIISDSATALVVAVLLALFWAGVGQVWHIYVALFLRALGGAFQWPAMRASTSLMVPDEHLARVAGLNSALQGAVTIASPALGALLLSLLPLHGILAVEIITAAMAVIPLLLTVVPQPAPSNRAPFTHVSVIFDDVLEGMRYLKSWPGLLGVIGMAMALNFFGYPINTLMPLVVTRHFNGTAWHLSFLEAMSGIGAIAGGLVLTLWGGFRRKIFTTLSGIIGTGVGTLVLAAVPTNLFWLAGAACLMLGVMGSIVNGPFQALIQSNVAPNIQGRVLTLMNSLISITMPVSVMIAGPLADHFGIMIWFWVSGITCLIIGIAGFFIPVIRDMEEHVAKKEMAADLSEPGL